MTRRRSLVCLSGICRLAAVAKEEEKKNGFHLGVSAERMIAATAFYLHRGLRRRQFVRSAREERLPGLIAHVYIRNVNNRAHEEEM